MTPGKDSCTPTPCGRQTRSSAKSGKTPGGDCQSKAFQIDSKTPGGSCETPGGPSNNIPINSVNSKYIFRGMITFYGRHYMAYFYSDKHDAWYQYDDAHIRRIGNWTDVKVNCKKGRAQPILLFYEKQEIIVNFLTQGGQLKHLPGYDKIANQVQKLSETTNKFAKHTPRPPGGIDLDNFAQMFTVRDKMGDPVPLNKSLIQMLELFYTNVDQHPDSFYFTEEGMKFNNFWTGTPGIIKSMTKKWFS